MTSIPSPPLEHGNCPSCGVSLDGGGIWEHFYQQAITEDKMSPPDAEAEADRIAELYGATRFKGRWGLASAMVVNDRVRSYHCGECKQAWDSNTGTLIQPQVQA
jgi:hypothetical protein